MTNGEARCGPLADAFGAVLGTERIQQLIDQGWLFETETWDRSRLRPAGYDLLISKENLQLPDPSGSPGTVPFGNGQEFPESAFILRPGDFAFVRTQERICLPWSLAANIGVKNRFAQKGLLILTGLLVDPGYGQERHEDGSWSRDPQPLHFGIANVGKNDVPITFGTDPVASIQFLEVAGPVTQKAIPPRRPGDPVARGFVLFGQFERQLTDIDDRLDRTSGKVDSVVLFGVYLIIATFIGALTAIFLGAIASPTLSANLQSMIDTVSKHPWPSAAIAVGLASVALALTAIAIWPLSRLLTPSRRRKGAGYIAPVRERVRKPRTYKWQLWRKAPDSADVPLAGATK